MMVCKQCVRYVIISAEHVSHPIKHRVLHVMKHIKDKILEKVRHFLVFVCLVTLTTDQISSANDAILNVLHVMGQAIIIV